MHLTLIPCSLCPNLAIGFHTIASGLFNNFFMAGQADLFTYIQVTTFFPLGVQLVSRKNSLLIKWFFSAITSHCCYIIASTEMQNAIETTTTYFGPTYCTISHCPIIILTSQTLSSRFEANKGRTKGSMCLYQRGANTNFFKNSFTFKGTQDWNNL